MRLPCVKEKSDESGGASRLMASWSKEDEGGVGEADHFQSAHEKLDTLRQKWSLLGLRINMFQLVSIEGLMALYNNLTSGWQSLAFYLFIFLKRYLKQHFPHTQFKNIESWGKKTNKQKNNTCTLPATLSGIDSSFI